MSDGFPAFSAAGQDGFTSQWEYKDDAVVLSSIGARCGKSFYATGQWTSLANTQCIFPKDELDARYLWFFTNDEERWERSGSAQPFIKPATIRSLLIPLPNIDTQRRIVARIDELFGEVDEGEAALARARADLGVWRKALLKAAVTGELTADWRAANPPTETGADLLTRILSKRRAKWLVDPKNTGKRYAEPASPEVAMLPCLPKGWLWTSLEVLLVGGIQNGLYMPQTAYGIGAPIMRIDDFQPANARSSGALRQVAVDSGVQALYSLSEGDCVINRVNSLSHLAKSFIVRAKHLPAMFESNMMRAKLSDTMNTDYLELYLSSEIGRARLCRNAKAAVNQASINQTDVSLTPVPIPPLSEQLAIVQNVSRNLDEEGQGEIAGLSAMSTTLRQSILAAAFRGELAA